MRMCLCIDLLCGILHTTHKKHVNILLDLKLVTKHILILREFDKLFVEEEIEENTIKIDFSLEILRIYIISKKYYQLLCENFIIKLIWLHFI